MSSAAGRRPALFTRDFILAWLANLCFFCAFQFLLPVLPLYVVAVGGRETDVGIIFALTSAGALPVRLVGGTIVDRYGRKPLLVLGGLLFLAAVSAYHWAASVPLIGALRLIQGLGYGALTGAATALVADIVPLTRRGEGMGIYSVGANVAQASAPAAGLFIYQATGFGPVFILAAAAAALAFLLSTLLHEPKRPTVAVRTESALLALREVLRPGAMLARSALLPSFIQVFASGCFSVVIAFVPLYAASLHLPNAGLFFTDVSLAVLLSRVFLGRLSDRVGRQQVALPAIGLVILSVALLALRPAPALFFLAGALFGLGNGGAQPALLAFAVDRTPAARRGAATSTFLIAVDIGVAVFTATLGQLIPVLGYSGLYAAAAVLLTAALAVYCMALFRRRTRGPAAASGNV